MDIIANGSRTIPAEKIRSAAICPELNPFLLNFISIKELPQIQQRITKISQLMVLLFIHKIEVANV
jgi:hypothetical protein